MGFLSKLFHESSTVVATPQETEIVKDPDVFPIMALPELVFIKIMSQLNWEALKTCRLVCDYWESLLRATLFSEDRICCYYTAGSGQRGVTSQTCTHQAWKTLFRLNPKRKLKFHTMRIRNSSFISTHFFRSWLFVKRLTNFSFDVKCVTRLEIDPFLVQPALTEDERIYEIWNTFLSLISHFKNVTELVVETKSDLLHEGFMLFTNDLHTRHAQLNHKYGKELKQLKKLERLVYSVDLPKISEYLVFLLLIGSHCDAVVDLKILVNYSQIWMTDLGRDNLYWIIGRILRKNFGTLLKVHIGTQNIYLGQYLKNCNRVERKDWLERYSNFSTNEMFEKLLDEMLTSKWTEMGLAVLEHFTLDFPIPIPPSPKIDTVLKPFLQSLVNLKTVKIQPILRGVSTANNIYIDTMFTKSHYGRCSYPVFLTDVIYFSDQTRFDWPALRSICHHSVIDLTLRKCAGGTSTSSRTIHWRNVSWQNIRFFHSIISAQLPFLTQLVIYQNIATCPPKQLLSIGDSELQMIIRDGKYLQELVLNCDLRKLTHFGYTGSQLFNCDIFHQIGMTPLNTSRKLLPGYSILNLRDLRRLVIIGLKGAPRPREITLWMEKSEFKFIRRYFQRRNYDFLRIRYDGTGSPPFRIRLSPNPLEYMWICSPERDEPNSSVWD